MVGLLMQCLASNGTEVSLVVSALGRLSARWPARDHVIDDFGDVGGVVAAALDVLGDEQQMGAQPDGARIFHHVGEKFAEQAVVDFVDLAVLAPHRFGRRRRRGWNRRPAPA